LSLEGNDRKGVGLQPDFVRLSWGFGKKLLAEVQNLLFLDGCMVVNINMPVWDRQGTEGMLKVLPNRLAKTKICLIPIL